MTYGNNWACNLNRFFSQRLLDFGPPLIPRSNVPTIDQWHIDSSLTSYEHFLSSNCSQLPKRDTGVRITDYKSSEIFKVRKRRKPDLRSAFKVQIGADLTRFSDILVPFPFPFHFYAWKIKYYLKEKNTSWLIRRYHSRFSAGLRVSLALRYQIVHDSWISDFQLQNTPRNM